MSINFQTANGAANWMHDKKTETFYGIQNNYRNNYRNEFLDYLNMEQYHHEEKRSNQPKTLVHGSHWNRLTGFHKGAYCALISVGARVIGVVEPLFKGLANIFSAPFSDKFSFKTGIKQLVVDFPLNILKLVFVMPIEVAADLFVTPFAVMLDTDYARAREVFESQLIVKHTYEYFRDFQEYQFDDRGFGEIQTFDLQDPRLTDAENF